MAAIRPRKTILFIMFIVASILTTVGVWHERMLYDAFHDWEYEGVVLTLPPPKVLDSGGLGYDAVIEWSNNEVTTFSLGPLNYNNLSVGKTLKVIGGYHPLIGTKGGMAVPAYPGKPDRDITQYMIIVKGAAVLAWLMLVKFGLRPGRLNRP